MKTTTSRYIQICLLVPILLLLGFFFGHEFKENEKGFDNDFWDKSHDGYTFINPLLSCADLPSESEGEARLLKERLSVIVNDFSRGKVINNASIYFRDLNNGPWISINENEAFVPASLLKMPLMMSILKMSEKNPAFFAKQIEYEGGVYPSDEYFIPESRLEMGKVYSVEELMRRMIIYSDNEAALLLNQLVDPEYSKETYSDLGLQNPTNGSYEITSKNYAAFFRILFNATYLSRDLSEMALNILGQSTFKEGLRSGVPAEIKVAHKFGEREEGSLKQLHDCGIVYFPTKPYLLCVMTQGSDFDGLARFISKVSSEVYKSLSEGWD